MKSKAERLKDVRRESILLHASGHFKEEGRHGTPVAVEQAISVLIGATEFLHLRLGKPKARLILERTASSL